MIVEEMEGRKLWLKSSKTSLGNSLEWSEIIQKEELRMILSECDLIKCECIFFSVNLSKRKLNKKSSEVMLVI